MSNITTRQMKNEMIHRLDEQLQSFLSTMNVLDSIDRMEDYDLIDQMMVADELMKEMNDLITRMNKVTNG